jgi:hypothetical protein
VLSAMKAIAHRSIGGVAALFAVTLWVCAPAHAEFGIESFGGAATDSGGARMSQAGAHPDLTTAFEFTKGMRDGGIQVAADNARNVRISLPAGLVGNPLAAPTCHPDDLTEVRGAQCPPETQVGVVDYTHVLGSVLGESGTVALYNVRPPRGLPARLGFNSGSVTTYIDPVVRPGDYGITARTRDASQSLPIVRVRVTLWGVPADPVHDAQRAMPDDFGGSFGHPSSAPRRPFTIAPTQCSGRALVTEMLVDAWGDPTPRHASFDSDFDGFPFINEGCDVLAFLPQSEIRASNSAPDAPTGLDVEISNPQRVDNPQGLADAQLRDVKVVLPDGMTINPGAADGLQACSDEQLGLGTDRPVGCPAGSKIGSGAASTPLLAEELTGSVFLRSQASDDPESGSMFRAALVFENEERGILVKLAGAIRVDAQTGKVTATFADNPQLPVDHVSVRLKVGARAPLVTPASCGEKTIETSLTSWAGHDLHQPSTAGVDCVAGLGGFAPGFTAGTVDPEAGKASPLLVGITKPDGDSDINGLSMTMPAGLLAKLKGNLGSQVGTVKAYAGPGSNPFMLPGQVYLEGRYGDAPFSLKVVVPAKAGPFDLGEVVVRQKIYVDPIDAHVTVVSDPLPTIVKGVPARIQKLEVSVDKPDFVLNPTSCAPKKISAVLGSVAAGSATVETRFQVKECSSLDVKPNLGLSLSGRGQTRDGGHPAVSAVLSQPAGGANLKKVRVTLPLSLALDPDNAASDALCSFVEGSKPDPKCPASSIVGKATAVSPILNEPLSGPVYFVKNERKDPKSGRSIKTTPKLVIPLTGENGVKLTLTGTSTVVDDQLVTTFDNLPDAPVSSFKMDINGGKKGILVISAADICKSTQIAEQEVDGQNNKAADASVYIQTPSCPLKVLSKKVGRSSVVVKVSGLGAGKVTVSGRGIKKSSKTITSATVATITTRRAKGKPGQVTVTFDPAGPAKARRASK